MVKAIVVSSLSELADGEPGTIKFNGDAIMFKCPCGCGGRGFLPFRDGDNDHPSWVWDGNKEQPTLTPSVHCTGWKCKWHGYLQNGEWKSV